MINNAPRLKDEFDVKRWKAKFSGEFICINGHTRMGRTEHFGPLRVQRPFYPEGLSCLHLYLLHPPGGLVGGDKLLIELDAQNKAHILMTTPSAGKIYRNISHIKQGQHVSIRVTDGAIVEYLPQENIVFNHADAQLITQVNIEGSGVFIGWEITCLGRIESNELFEVGGLEQSLSVYQEGKPLFLDRLSLVAPSTLQTQSSGFQNKSVFATFVVNQTIDDAALLEKIVLWQQKSNELITPAMVAITQKPGVFIARFIGDKSEQARDIFEALWTMLRPSLINKQTCAPRIWRT